MIITIQGMWKVEVRVSLFRAMNSELTFFAVFWRFSFLNFFIISEFEARVLFIVFLEKYVWTSEWLLFVTLPKVYTFRNETFLSFFFFSECFTIFSPFRNFKGILEEFQKIKSNYFDLWIAICSLYSYRLFEFFFFNLKPFCFYKQTIYNLKFFSHFRVVLMRESRDT